LRGDRALAARILGISRRTSFYKLSDMSLDD
jgi:Bacterial regulatory protein, Fis family